MTSNQISESDTPDVGVKSKPEVTLTAKSDNEETSEDTTQHAHGFHLASIIIGLTLAVFCLGLDRTILATAIPKITTQFNSLDDVAWYGSSYMLTSCCFQLIFGKLYSEFHVRWVFLSALALFELGSIVCASAPGSIALIIGRAIAGIGCAGLLSGTFIIIAQSLPLDKRPIYTGVIGGMAGISELVAPTLGGALTDHASWRWCFWINLPLGAVTAAVVFIFIRPPPPTKTTPSHHTGLYQFLTKLDPIGTALLMPFMISLLLALEWGGSTYPWSNWRIILCLSLFGVLFLAWLFVQYIQGDTGTLPLRLMRNRSVASGTLFMLGVNGAVFIVVYYVSIWFQAVKGTTAQQSGINFLTSSTAVSVASVVAGALTSKIGYYVPQMIASAIITSVAAGLIFRYNLETSTVYWAGTLVMFGFGAGLGMQMPLSAIQTVLRGPDVSRGTSLLMLAQSLSGSIFLAVGQNLFQSKLIQELKSKAPGVDAAAIISNGASGLQDVISREYGEGVVGVVLEAYNTALRDCFLVCVVLSCLTIVGALGVEWKSVKGSKKEEGADDEGK